MRPMFEKSLGGVTWYMVRVFKLNGWKETK